MKYLKRFNQSINLLESSFFKGEREQFEEDKSYINDIFIPLVTEEVLTCEVTNKKIYYGQPENQLVIIESPRRNIQQGKYLQFSEFKDEILHLKSYLGSRCKVISVLFTGSHHRQNVEINEEEYDYLDQWFQTGDGQGIINIVIFFSI